MTKNPIPDLMKNQLAESLKTDEARLEELKKSVKEKKVALAVLSKEEKQRTPFFRTSVGRGLNHAISWATRGAANSYKKAESKLRDPDTYEYQKVLDGLIDACCDAELIKPDDKRAKKIANRLAKLHLEADDVLSRAQTISVEDRARLKAFQKDAAQYIEHLQPDREEVKELVRKLEVTLQDFGSHAALLGMPKISEEKNDVEHRVCPSNSDDSRRTSDIFQAANENQATSR